MTTDAPDALDLARSELAAEMIPAPDDLLGDVGPLAVLHYCREALVYAVTSWTAQLAEEQVDEAPGGGELANALQAMCEALGALSVASVEVHLLPAGYLDGASDASQG